MISFILASAGKASLQESNVAIFIFVVISLPAVIIHLEAVFSMGNYAFLKLLISFSGIQDFWSLEIFLHDHIFVAVLCEGNHAPNTLCLKDDIFWDF